MATRKITITLDADLFDRARRAVDEGRAKSVSAYVADAVGNRARREEFQEFLDTYFEPSTPESQAWAHRVIYGVDPQQ